ncbi:transposase [Streptomyces sp. NPDC006544]|uniref:transposase n=1 Tax=Streptomyces sp. NPDC006544 TaxID=3154583 RepID=UPI0033A23047
MRAGPLGSSVGVYANEFSRRPCCRSSTPSCGPGPVHSPRPSCACLAHRFGKAADNGTRQLRYPTDMTDTQWAVVRPLLPVPGWLRGRGQGGRPEAYCHRTMLDAIHHLVDNRTKWRAMPAVFPPWDRVYAFFRRWREHGPRSSSSTTGCAGRSARRRAVSSGHRCGRRVLSYADVGWGPTSEALGAVRPVG